MADRIYCPECETAFAYSPALLGRTVRCRQCQHTFTVAFPPGEMVASPAPAEAAPGGPPPLPKVPAPPPLPVRAGPDRAIPSGARRDDAFDRRPRRRDGDDLSRRRPAAGAEPRSGTGALIGLLVAFGLGFLIIAGGVGYLLWPSSPATNTVDGPAPPAESPAAIDPPKDLDQIMKMRPDAGNLPDRPDNPGLPRFPGKLPKGPRGRGLPIEPPGGLEVPPGFPGDLRPGPPDFVPRQRPAVPAPKFLPVTPLPVEPTPLTYIREERKLAAPVENAVVAGGGRLILLQLPKLKMIAAFDVNTGKVKHIDAKDERALVAGGMNVFVIYLPEQKILERWNCATLEREAELKSVFPEEVLALEMGSATNGPLVAALGGARRTIHGGATLGYFDPMTGKEVSYEIGGNENPFGIGPHGAAVLVRVSAGGSVVTAWSGRGDIHSDVIDGGRVTCHSSSGSDFLFPSADGQVLFGRGTRFPPDLRAGGPGQRPGAPWIIPATQGDFFVSVQPGVGRGRPGSPAWAEIMTGTETRPVLRIGELPDFEVPGAFDSRGTSLDRNIILVPEAKLLAVIPLRKRDQMFLYRADLEKGMTQANIDYLYVASRPPTGAVKGATYRYAMAVKSRKGGVRVTLDSGPKGMSVTPEGIVTWDVPTDYAEADVAVMLKVTDGSKRAVQSYRLAVRDKSDAPARPKGR